MHHKKIYLTKEGLDELKKEYEELTKVKRPQVVARVSDARDMGDLSENAEYSAAREELSFIDGRIEELEELLKQVVMIEGNGTSSSSSRVQLGSKVTVHAGDRKEDYMVVGEWEADPTEKKISHESPLGKALMGKVVGDTFDVDAPAGKISYKIIAVS